LRSSIASRRRFLAWGVLYLFADQLAAFGWLDEAPSEISCLERP
jgi:hypothetical protein